MSAPVQAELTNRQPGYQIVNHHALSCRRCDHRHWAARDRTGDLYAVRDPHGTVTSPVCQN